LHDKLSVVGADLLSETLPTIFNKTNESIKQDESLATFAPNISRELERINWQNDHETVYNHVRGLHPWPVAYTTYHNERSEEHTSELQSRFDIVCRLMLEKKK